MGSSVLESREWAEAQLTENELHQWLVRNGWAVVPQTDLRSPWAKREGECIVLPDFRCYCTKNGKHVQVEVKRKSKPNEYKKSRVNRIPGTGRLVHGIGRKHHNDYTRIQNIEHVRIYLVIHEVANNLFIARALDELPIYYTYDGDKMDPGGMVFFDREEFYTLDEIDDLKPLEIHLPTRPHKLTQQTLFNLTMIVIFSTTAAGVLCSLLSWIGG